MKKREDWRIMENNKIKAVYSNEMYTLLDSIGEGEAFREGRCTCSFCDVVVTIENIHSVFPHDMRIAYCCNSPVCKLELVEMSE